MSSTKKSLWASGVALLASVALLAGTTFAWFTDSVTNKGNNIQAGSLDIALSELQEDGSYLDISDSEEPIFGYTLWEPGHTDFTALKVSNEGSLALKFNLTLRANGKVGILGDVIDVYACISETAVTKPASFAEITAADSGYRNVGTLNSLIADPDGAARGVLYAAGDANMPEGGSSAVYCGIALHMREDAGNEYQGESIGTTFDIVLNAGQYTYEEDGFGSSDYDEPADYSVLVSTPEAFQAAAAQGGHLKLANDLVLPEGLTFAYNTTLDLNGHTLTLGADGSAALKAAPFTTLTVQGNGTIYGALYADNRFSNGSTLVINAGPDFEVISNSANGWAVYGGQGSTVKINGGTYTSSEKEGGSGAIHLPGLGSHLEVKNAVVNVGPDSVMDAYGIYSSASVNLLENVTVNAKYSSAVNFNYVSGSATIRGGSFITNQQAPDMPVNPTIRYQGTLDISNASITRVGVGILYTATGATELKGLTEESCTFQAVGENNPYADIDFKK